MTEMVMRIRMMVKMRFTSYKMNKNGNCKNTAPKHTNRGTSLLENVYGMRLQA